MDEEERKFFAEAGREERPAEEETSSGEWGECTAKSARDGASIGPETEGESSSKKSMMGNTKSTAAKTMAAPKVPKEKVEKYTISSDDEGKPYEDVSEAIAAVSAKKNGTLDASSRSTLSTKEARRSSRRRVKISQGG